VRVAANLHKILGGGRKALLRRLEEALGAPEFPSRRVSWNEWYGASFLKTIEATKAEWEKKHGDLQKLVRELAPDRADLTEQEKHDKGLKEVQSYVYRVWHEEESYSKDKRVDEKLARWRVTLGPKTKKARAVYDLGRISPNMLTEGWARRKMLDNMSRLTSLVAPKVQYVVFRTIWNGWQTERRRWQNRDGLCPLCSMEGCEDSIEHMCRDLVVLDAAHRKLRLVIHGGDALLYFLLLAPAYREDADLCLGASLVYATFMTSNHIRLIKENGTYSTDTHDREYVFDHLMQRVVNAVTGHRVSQDVLDNRWADRRTVSLSAG